jgi:dienelactone hydrolase
MRKDISFKTDDGLTLRGWHYLPDGRSGKVPTIVMAHGFSAVKEMYLDRFAEAFAAAGLAAIVFDNRNFGASDGEPRQEIDPWKQVRDYRDAITYAQGLPEADPDRIGIWGSSYSGGHVIVVGAIDRRVKCVVAQVPLASGHENARRLVRADYLAGLHAAFDEDRRSRMKGSAPAMIPVPRCSWWWRGATCLRFRTWPFRLTKKPSSRSASSPCPADISTLTSRISKRRPGPRQRGSSSTS